MQDGQWYVMYQTKKDKKQVSSALKPNISTKGEFKKKDKSLKLVVRADN